ncbi:WxL domain-containing protein [uncultured Vagococcus sp.]|uniref:WxL domain-containing protein n=1 Tax=uncultured Vagococcus sp. TaxID=189676 RepID=UPI0028D8BD38|nr:WxL domain-containing protein [uncultured Vagococcus sp.]
MKTKLLTSVTISALVLGGLSGVALAAESKGSTTADAEFLTGSRPTPGKPEEGPKDPEQIDPDPDPKDPSKPKPLPESNGVYVTHLPNFSFGADNKTDLKTAEYQAQLEKRTKNQGADTFHMPHSVQVADVSGNDLTTWKLSVSQDEAFKTAGDKPKTLTNSRIRIYGNTLTSSAHTNQELSGKLSGAALGSTDVFGTYSEIPVGNADSLAVLSNKTAGFTLNSYSSAVFKDSYLAADYSVVKTPTAEKYEGVKLNVPAADQSQAKAYVANLTWTLTVEP